MTWSIVARDPASGAFGVAIATRFFAVGGLCIYAASGVGAVATQALVNPHFGPRALDLLRAGRAPEEAVSLLVAADEGREHRQLHMIDAHDRTAAWTGGACVDWCGQFAGPGYSVAGNMLAGEAVVTTTGRAFEAAADLPFPRRLIAAMTAGEAAGGDKRGKQSAALLIHSTEDYPDLSLRVDDHAEPLGELARLEAVSRERFVHFRRFLPSRQSPAGVFDRAEIEAGIAAALEDQGK